MTTQLYLQKAEMQLARGMEEKALESLLRPLPVRTEMLSAKPKSVAF